MNISDLMLNEPCNFILILASSSMYHRQPTPNIGQRTYDHQNEERLAPNKTYTLQMHSKVDLPKREAPVGSASIPKTAENADIQPSSSSQLPSDTKYDVTSAMERCSISRALSNDHLLETTNGKSPYARKDLPLQQKSKSVENIGNGNEDEVGTNTSKLYFSCLL